MAQLQFHSSVAAKRRAARARQFFGQALTGLGLLAGLANPVLAQPPDTLSLDMAVNAAVERSLHAGAHEASAASARELAAAASRLPDPVLRVSVDNVPVEGPSRWSLRQDFMTMQSIGLMQTFVAREKREALSDRYEQQARLADAERAVELAALQRAAAQAWLDRYYQERVFELLDAQRAEASLLVETAEAAYRSGQVSQADVFGARSEAALLADSIEQAEIELGNAIATLERWIGDRARLPLSSLPAWEEQDLQIPDAGRQAQRVWLAQQEEVARAETRVARTSRRPDWNLELMYGKRGSSFEDMVSLGVSVPLQLGRRHKQDRELAASLAELEHVQRLRAEDLRDYQLQIQAWQNSWRGNLRRLNNYDTALLPLARQRTEAALSAYRGNTAALSEVVEARQAQIALNIERTNLERATAGLWTQLRFLTPATATGSMTRAPENNISGEPEDE